MKKDISLTEIAERIADSIMQESYLDRENLIKVIRPVLSIWIKHADKGKKNKKLAPKHIRTIEDRDLQCRYWHDLAKKNSSIEEMKVHYTEIERLRKEEGYAD